MSPPVPKTAMVFAAGLGTRMRPITETLPKPLVKVHGRTLIDYCLDRLAENGVERAIVNVHWLADQIEAHLAKRRAPKVLISDERTKLLDQGGGIKRALPLEDKCTGSRFNRRQLRILFLVDAESDQLQLREIAADSANQSQPISVS